MAKEDDIKLIIRQESELLFSAFDEMVAFKLGSYLRDQAIKAGHGIVVDVRTWDRPMFYAALPGTTGDNQNWVRRKINLVRTVMKSSYRVVLEKNWEGDVFPARRALDSADYALAGGSFPIKVKGAGMIGAITVSGLHERDDHRLAVDAICAVIGIDGKPFTLPPL